PFYGSRRMVAVLRREGLVVNRKRVRRLMRVMGLEAIYQKPNTSQGHPDNKVYPYLLRGLIIDRPNQVWCADITYIPMAKGFVYLVAVMDWFSRRVLSWRFRKRWPNMVGRRFSTPIKACSLSRIAAIDGVVVTLFDGLPASASRRAVGIVGSGSGSSDAPSLIKRCAGRSGPSRSSARRARHARRKEAAARGSARLRASLDRRCDQRSVRLQAGTEKRRSNRTEKHEGRRR